MARSMGAGGGFPPAACDGSSYRSMSSNEVASRARRERRVERAYGASSASIAALWLAQVSATRTRPTVAAALALASFSPSGGRLRARAMNGTHPYAAGGVQNTTRCSTKGAAGAAVTLGSQLFRKAATGSSYLIRHAICSNVGVTSRSIAPVQGKRNHAQEVSVEEEGGEKDTSTELVPLFKLDHTQDGPACACLPALEPHAVLCCSAGAYAGNYFYVSKDAHGDVFGGGPRLSPPALVLLAELTGAGAVSEELVKSRQQEEVTLLQEHLQREKLCQQAAFSVNVAKRQQQGQKQEEPVQGEAAAAAKDLLAAQQHEEPQQLSTAKEQDEEIQLLEMPLNAPAQQQLLVVQLTPPQQQQACSQEGVEAKVLCRRQQQLRQAFQKVDAQQCADANQQSPLNVFRLQPAEAHQECIEQDSQRYGEHWKEQPQLKSTQPLKISNPGGLKKTPGQRQEAGTQLFVKEDISGNQRILITPDVHQLEAFTQADVTLRIEHAGLSALHARIWEDPGRKHVEDRLNIQDLASREGTWKKVRWDRPVPVCRESNDSKSSSLRGTDAESISSDRADADEDGQREEGEKELRHREGRRGPQNRDEFRRAKFKADLGRRLSTRIAVTASAPVARTGDLQRDAEAGEGVRGSELGESLVQRKSVATTSSASVSWLAIGRSEKGRYTDATLLQRGGESPRQEALFDTAYITSLSVSSADKRSFATPEQQHRFQKPHRRRGVGQQEKECRKHGQLQQARRRLQHSASETRQDGKPQRGSRKRLGREREREGYSALQGRQGRRKSRQVTCQIINFAGRLLRFERGPPLLPSEAFDEFLLAFDLLHLKDLLLACLRQRGCCCRRACRPRRAGAAGTATASAPSIAKKSRLRDICGGVRTDGFSAAGAITAKVKPTAQAAAEKAEVFHVEKDVLSPNADLAGDALPASKSLVGELGSRVEVGHWSMRDVNYSRREKILPMHSAAACEDAQNSCPVSLEGRGELRKKLSLSPYTTRNRQGSDAEVIPTNYAGSIGKVLEDVHQSTGAVEVHTDGAGNFFERKAVQDEKEDGGKSMSDDAGNDICCTYFPGGVVALKKPRATSISRNDWRGSCWNMEKVRGEEAIQLGGDTFSERSSQRVAGRQGRGDPGCYCTRCEANPLQWLWRTGPVSLVYEEDGSKDVIGRRETSDGKSLSAASAVPMGSAVTAAEAGAVVKRILPAIAGKAEAFGASSRRDLVTERRLLLLPKPEEAVQPVRKTRPDKRQVSLRMLLTTDEAERWRLACVELPRHFLPVGKKSGPLIVYDEATGTKLGEVRWSGCTLVCHTPKLGVARMATNAPYTSVASPDTAPSGATTAPASAPKAQQQVNLLQGGDTEKLGAGHMPHKETSMPSLQAPPGHQQAQLASTGCEQCRLERERICERIVCDTPGRENIFASEAVSPSRKVSPAESAVCTHAEMMTFGTCAHCSQTLRKSRRRLIPRPKQCQHSVSKTQHVAGGDETVCCSSLSKRVWRYSSAASSSSNASRIVANSKAVPGFPVVVQSVKRPSEETSAGMVNFFLRTFGPGSDFSSSHMKGFWGGIADGKRRPPYMTWASDQQCSGNTLNAWCNWCTDPLKDCDCWEVYPAIPQREGQTRVTSCAFTSGDADATAAAIRTAASSRPELSCKRQIALPIGGAGSNATASGGTGIAILQIAAVASKAGGAEASSELRRKSEVSRAIPAVARLATAVIRQATTPSAAALRPVPEVEAGRPPRSTAKILRKLQRRSARENATVPEDAAVEAVAQRLRTSAASLLLQGRALSETTPRDALEMVRLHHSSCVFVTETSPAPLSHDNNVRGDRADASAAAAAREFIGEEIAGDGVVSPQVTASAQRATNVVSLRGTDHGKEQSLREMDRRARSARHYRRRRDLKSSGQPDDGSGSMDDDREVPSFPKFISRYFVAADRTPLKPLQEERNTAHCNSKRWSTSVDDICSWRTSQRTSNTPFRKVGSLLWTLRRRAAARRKSSSSPSSRCTGVLSLKNLRIRIAYPSDLGRGERTESNEIESLSHKFDRAKSLDEQQRTVSGRREHLPAQAGCPSTSKHISLSNSRTIRSPLLTSTFPADKEIQLTSVAESGHSKIARRSVGCRLSAAVQACLAPGAAGGTDTTAEPASGRRSLAAVAAAPVLAIVRSAAAALAAVTPAFLTGGAASGGLAADPSPTVHTAVRASASCVPTSTSVAWKSSLATSDLPKVNRPLSSAKSPVARAVKGAASESLCFLDGSNFQCADGTFCTADRYGVSATAPLIHACCATNEVLSTLSPFAAIPSATAGFINSATITQQSSVRADVFAEHAPLAGTACSGIRRCRSSLCENEGTTRHFPLPAPPRAASCITKFQFSTERSVACREVKSVNTTAIAAVRQERRQKKPQHLLSPNGREAPLVEMAPPAADAEVTAGRAPPANIAALIIAKDPAAVALEAGAATPNFVAGRKVAKECPRVTLDTGDAKGIFLAYKPSSPNEGVSAVVAVRGGSAVAHTVHREDVQPENLRNTGSVRTNRQGRQSILLEWCRPNGDAIEHSKQKAIVQSEKAGLTGGWGVSDGDNARLREENGRRVQSDGSPSAVTATSEMGRSTIKRSMFRPPLAHAVRGSAADGGTSPDHQRRTAEWNLAVGCGSPLICARGLCGKLQVGGGSDAAVKSAAVQMPLIGGSGPYTAGKGGGALATEAAKVDCNREVDAAVACGEKHDVIHFSTQSGSFRQPTASTMVLVSTRLSPAKVDAEDMARSGEHHFAKDTTEIEGLRSAKDRTRSGGQHLARDITRSGGQHFATASKEQRAGSAASASPWEPGCWIGNFGDSTEPSLYLQEHIVAEKLQDRAVSRRVAYASQPTGGVLPTPSSGLSDDDLPVFDWSAKRIHLQDAQHCTCPRVRRSGSSECSSPVSQRKIEMRQSGCVDSGASGARAGSCEGRCDTEQKKEHFARSVSSLTETNRCLRSPTKLSPQRAVFGTSCNLPGIMKTAGVCAAAEPVSALKKEESMHLANGVDDCLCVPDRQVAAEQRQLPQALANVHKLASRHIPHREKGFCYVQESGDREDIQNGDKTSFCSGGGDAQVQEAEPKCVLPQEPQNGAVCRSAEKESLETPLQRDVCRVLQNTTILIKQNPSDRVEEFVDLRSPYLQWQGAGKGAAYNGNSDLCSDGSTSSKSGNTRSSEVGVMTESAFLPQILSSSDGVCRAGQRWNVAETHEELTGEQVSLPDGSKTNTLSAALSLEKPAKVPQAPQMFTKAATRGSLAPFVKQRFTQSKSAQLFKPRTMQSQRRLFALHPVKRSTTASSKMLLEKKHDTVQRQHFSSRACARQRLSLFMVEPTAFPKTRELYNWPGAHLHEISSTPRTNGFRRTTHSGSLTWSKQQASVAEDILHEGPAVTNAADPLCPNCDIKVKEPTARQEATRLWCEEGNAQVSVSSVRGRAVRCQRVYARREGVEMGAAVRSALKEGGATNALAPTLCSFTNRCRTGKEASLDTFSQSDFTSEVAGKSSATNEELMGASGDTRTCASQLGEERRGWVRRIEERYTGALSALQLASPAVQCVGTKKNVSAKLSRRQASGEKEAVFATVSAEVGLVDGRRMTTDDVGLGAQREGPIKLLFRKDCVEDEGRETAFDGEEISGGPSGTHLTCEQFHNAMSNESNVNKGEIHEHFGKQRNCKNDLNGALVENDQQLHERHQCRQEAFVRGRFMKPGVCARELRSHLGFRKRLDLLQEKGGHLFSKSGAYRKSAREDVMMDLQFAQEKESRLLLKARTYLLRQKPRRPDFPEIVIPAAASGKHRVLVTPEVEHVDGKSVETSAGRARHEMDRSVSSAGKSPWPPLSNETMKKSYRHGSAISGEAHAAECNSRRAHVHSENPQYDMVVHRRKVAIECSAWQLQRPFPAQGEDELAEEDVCAVRPRTWRKEVLCVYAAGEFQLLLLEPEEDEGQPCSPRYMIAAAAGPAPAEVGVNDDVNASCECWQTRSCWVRLRAKEHDRLRPGDVLRLGPLLEFSLKRFLTGVASQQGYRVSMEDEEIVIQDLGVAEDVYCSFLAVYDGHGGRACAEFVKRILHITFRDELLQMCGGSLSLSSTVRQHVFQALIKAFLATDAAFLVEQQRRKRSGLGSTSGCACVVVVILGGELWCANCGDARAVLCRGGKAIQLSSDHKPHRKDELQRIVAAGGFVRSNRVLGRLAVSRAFGDVDYKNARRNSASATVNRDVLTSFSPSSFRKPFSLSPKVTGSNEMPDGSRWTKATCKSSLPNFDVSRALVTAVPEIRMQQLCEEDEFLLLACDGLFDVFTSQEAAEFVKEALRRRQVEFVDPQSIVDALLNEAIVKRRSRDNVTAILVILSPGGCNVARASPEPRPERVLSKKGN